MQFFDYLKKKSKDKKLKTKLRRKKMTVIIVNVLDIIKNLDKLHTVPRGSWINYDGKVLLKLSYSS